MIMGCYGIGVSRILAAAAEVNNDENGLVWPMNIAPYQVHLIAANVTDETQLSMAERMHYELTGAGIEVLYDDRSERAGVKFKDADLIGIPIQMVVGKLASEGKVEIRSRATKSAEAVHGDDVLMNIRSRIQSNA